MFTWGKVSSEIKLQDMSCSFLWKISKLTFDIKSERKVEKSPRTAVQTVFYKVWSYWTSSQLRQNSKYNEIARISQSKKLCAKNHKKQLNKKPKNPRETKRTHWHCSGGDEKSHKWESFRINLQSTIKQNQIQSW